MNPGKVVEPYRLDENLRVNPELKMWQPETHFKFPADHGSLAGAAARCVGVGKCRSDEGGVMCPSYRVTREEEHSTRGRARLLWEMAQGEVLKGQWRDEAVKESLDLCLACKGCKSDCPVSVDMASYKSEFLSHYYEGRMRPRSAYAFAHIDRWARLASVAPWLGESGDADSGIARNLAKWVAGMPQQRKHSQICAADFSLMVFKAGTACIAKTGRYCSGRIRLTIIFFRRRQRLRWRFWSMAGFEVKLPRKVLCCGRPLYDFGFLDTRKTSIA